MKAETNELIRNYAAGFSCIETAIRGVSDEELDFTPSPDAWSVKEILIHLADAELVVVDRMKRIIAEDAPPMRTMYQELWARRLHYGKLDHEPYLRLFRLLRETMSEVLSELDEDAFDRVGYHDERGEMTLRAVVERYTDHVESHVGQIERNLAAFRLRRGDRSAAEGECR